MILQLQRRHVNLLKKITENMYPIEACAMLFGTISQNLAVIKRIEVTQNRLQSTTRFEVDPAKVAAAVLDAETKGLELIGLFHSHPAPAKPSVIDKKFMRLWGDSIWLIISTTDGNLAAYQMIDDKVKRVSLTIK